MFHTKEKLTYQGTQSFNSEYQSFQVAPCHEPKDGRLSVDWNSQSCRDGLGTTMRNAINGGQLETDKLRLLLVWQSYSESTAEPWFERGLACVHAFEKLAGWPLTRAIRVDLPNKKYGVYVRGSRRWLKCSYLVTLYVLLFRMCKDSRISGFKNFDDMIKTIRSIGNLQQDSGHVSNTIGYWKAIALGYPYLFEQYKITHYWSTGQVGGDAYGEGIAKLCSGSSSWTEMNRKLREVKADIDKNGKLTLERKKAKKKS